MAMESTASMRGGEGEKGVSATTTIYIPISKPHPRSDISISDILFPYRPSAAVSAPVLPASSAASALRTAANAAAKRCCARI